MNNIPRIKDVKPLKNMMLAVTFKNGVIKEYDVKPLVKSYEIFKCLENESIFNLVRVDAGGFGIAWTDDIDLSEYEIWQNGIATSLDDMPTKAG